MFHVRGGIALALLAMAVHPGCSCSSELPERPDVQVAPVQARAALVLSFDDHFVEEWAEVMPLFEQYGARATFFVDRFDRLDWDLKSKIIDFESAGHEIGCHGFRHVGAEDFKGDVTAYVEQEIVPARKPFEDVYLTIRNYAYPKGQRTEAHDSAILQHYELVRGTTHRRQNDDGWAPLREWDDIYYSYQGNPGLVLAAGIDDRHEVPIEDIRAAFQRALDEQSAIFLYAHRPSNDNNSTANIDPNYLEQVLQAAVETGLEFYRVSDFVDLAGN